MIEVLQASSAKAVQEMEQDLEESADAVNQANKAGEALGVIDRAVSVIDDLNIQIASATEEQSAVAEKINKNINAINAAADEAEASVHETA